jgi:hypothetical protein
LFDRPKPTAGCSTNRKRRRNSPLNWKGGEEEEDPGKDGEKWKEIFMCWE